MRFNYCLYPEGIKKIQNSGIEAKIKEIENSEDGLPFFGGCIMQNDIIEAVKELKGNGYYKDFPKEFMELYKNTLDGILNDPEKFQWTVQRPSGKVIEPCDLEDLLLFTGEIASIVLKPDEIWDYKKFGFSSLSEFVATVSVYILQQSRGHDFREGYKWIRKRKDESEIVTEITGDMHSDLRIFQTDIAPYPTMDPFKNKVYFRPEMPIDRHVIAAHHSTEATLFVAVMQYIEQQQIKVDFFKDSAKELISWGRSFGQGGGNCTEHFGGFDRDPDLFFIGYNLPIPQLDKNYETSGWTNYLLGTDASGAYGAYISPEGDFILSYQKSDDIKNPVKPAGARFLPEDAEHVIKGLIYQSATGLGRTSAKQLLDILEFRFSEDFVKFMDKLNHL